MVWLLWTHIFLCHDRARKIMQTHKYKFILYISMQTHRVIRKCRIFILIGKFCVLFHWRFGLRYCVFSFIRWISSNITLDTFYDHAIFGITFLFELEMESLSGSGASNVPPMVANESSGNAIKQQRNNELRIFSHKLWFNLICRETIACALFLILKFEALEMIKHKNINGVRTRFPLTLPLHKWTFRSQQFIGLNRIVIVFFFSTFSNETY